MHGPSMPMSRVAISAMTTLLGEGAVIETPLQIKAGGHAATLEHCADGLRPCWSAGCIVADAARTDARRATHAS
jgi:hypothetical protein